MIEISIPTGRVINNVNEYNYNGVRYLYRPGKNKLAVTFSAFTSFGNEQKYNYIKSIPNDYALLSILDTNEPENDPRGTYYLSIEGINDYMLSVGEVINFAVIQCNVQIENITLIGSSKGAFAALYCSFLNNINNVIVNAPQFEIAKYIKRRSNCIHDYLCTRYEGIKLDSFIKNVITNASDKDRKKITVLCGIDDIYHLKELQKYENVFLESKIRYTKVILPGGHDDCCVQHYLSYLKAQLNCVNFGGRS